MEREKKEALFQGTTIETSSHLDKEHLFLITGRIIPRIWTTKSSNGEQRDPVCKYKSYMLM